MTNFQPMLRANAVAAPPVDPQHAETVKQVQKWVSQTFYGTMLRQMRNSPFKSEMFDGGRGGEAYHQMFDQRLADHMSRGTGKKLVDALVRKIEGAKAYRKASKLAHATPPAQSNAHHPVHTPPHKLHSKFEQAAPIVSRRMAPWPAGTVK